VCVEGGSWEEGCQADGGNLHSAAVSVGAEAYVLRRGGGDITPLTRFLNLAMRGARVCCCHHLRAVGEIVCRFEHISPHKARLHPPAPCD